MAQAEAIGTEVKGKFFTIFVDGKEFHLEQSTITGASGAVADL